MTLQFNNPPVKGDVSSGRTVDRDSEAAGARSENDRDIGGRGWASFFGLHEYYLVVGVGSGGQVDQGVVTDVFALDNEFCVGGD